VRRVLISCVLVAVALIAQLTIINRLALPGGAGPDLVLLAVVALALTSGPVPGMLTGFFAGLALDIAPPASHTIGQYALVFCLVGYTCGRLAALGEASPALYVAFSAAAAAVGAALHAALGIMLSDPQVTWSAVRHVLPPSLAYDVILSPFILYAVVRLGAWAGGAATGQEGTQAAGAAGAGRLASALRSSGPAAGTVRQASVSGTPNLHLGSRRSSDAWVGAAGAASAARLGAGQRPGGKREPKLHFGGARRASAARLGAGQRPGGKREPKLHFGGARRASAARLGAGQRPGGKREPKLRFGGARGASGISPAATARLRGGAAASRLTGPKSVPRMRFGTGRRRGGGLAGGGSGALPRSARGAAVPRFRKRRAMGAIGTGGSFTGGRPGGGAFGGRSAPRLRMRRGRMRSKIRRLMGRGTGGYR
jgi:rod shape-determining protein MreD